MGRRGELSEGGLDLVLELVLEDSHGDPQL